MKMKNVLVRETDEEYFGPEWKLLTKDQREFGATVVRVPIALWNAYKGAQEMVWRFEQYLSTLPKEHLPARNPEASE